MEKRSFMTDRNGKVIGSLTEDGKVFDRNGKLCGKFNKDTDRTSDRTGKNIGGGDQRSRLVK